MKVSEPVTFAGDVHERTIRTASWHPSKPVLALGSFDSKGSVWELIDGKWVHQSEIEGHENEIKGISWSPDGSMLATCSRDKSVWLFETPANGVDDEFACISVLNGHTQDVKALRWARDGSQLFSVSYDDTVRVWAHVEAEDDWMLEQTLHGHKATVWSLDVHPRRQCIATASDDQTVRLWRRYPIEDKKKTSTATATAPVAHHPGSTLGKQMASVAGAPFWAMSPLYNSILATNQTGENAAAAEGMDVDEEPADVEYGEWKFHCALAGMHQRTIYSVQWSPCGRFLATAAADNYVRVFKADDEKELTGWKEVWSFRGTCDANCVAWKDVGDAKAVLGAVFDDGVAKFWKLDLEALEDM